MSFLNVFFSIIDFLFILIKSVHLAYIFQTKEYRFDRVNSFFREKGFFKTLYLEEIRLPAKSIRNLLLVGFSFSADALLIFLFYQRINILFVFFSFSPLIAFIFISGGVLITNIFSNYRRNKIIKKAKEKISHSKAKFIAVVGSYGKTSVKEFLYQILKTKYKVGKTDENQNTKVGVALSILKNLKKDTQFFIVEMGAYKKGEIKEICKMTPPSYTILTAIGNQHLSLFGSKKAILEAKSEAIEALPNRGILYVNQEIKNIKKIITHKEIIFRFFANKKINQQTDIYIKKSFPKKGGIENLVVYRDQIFNLKVNLIGRHNITNLLAPVGLSVDLRLTKREIEKSISNIKEIDAKLSHSIGINKALVFNNSYNSNLNGFINAIEIITSIKNKKRKIIISKGITELGKEKKDSYRKILKKLEGTKIILLTNDQLFKLLDKKSQVKLFKNEKRLFKKLKKMVNSESLLLIEGKFTRDFIKRII